jgi:protein SCO1/2
MTNLSLKSRKPLYSLLIAVALIPLTLVISVLAQDNNTLQITGAWARPSTEGNDNDVSAAYLQITNRGDRDDALLAVTAGVARITELHTMQMDGDVMRMRQVERIDIPAGETVALRPGGLHIMLMGLNAPLIEGEFVTLTLTFESGAVIMVEALITSQPIPYTLPVDSLTEQALAAVTEGIYVGQVVNPPIMTQDVAVPSSHADIAALSDLNGTWRVIFFGYMRCPDFCPLTLVEYKRVKALLGEEASEVKFVFITVDAVRDTPEALQRYLANFDPDFIGFAADDATLARIQPDYGFYYERRMGSSSQDVYTIDHSTRSYLLDREGILRASFAYDAEPRAIADALLWYLEHE